MSKDWIGNSKAAYVCNGASNHSEKDRAEHDYYATEPKAVEMLLGLERFRSEVWECACGGGHISEILKSAGYNVRSSDLIDRGYPGTENLDFLKIGGGGTPNTRDIITNPPYKYAREFVEQALAISEDGVKIAMFLKLTFLEGKARRKLFEVHPPKTVWVSSSRLQCAKNGDFNKYKQGASTAVAYAWYIWEKGHQGETTIKWFN